MLGVHWSAHQERIDAAFAEEMWLLQSSHYPASFSPVDDLERHRLVKALEHAYATLGDPESRRAYRAEIHDASEIAAAVKVYRDKADMALFRRQKSQARDPLLRVQELDPENSFAREHLREFDPAT